MFSTIVRLAEGLAESVSTSRRGFLGRVGKSALGVAAALGALAVTASAQSGDVVCCTYHCTNFPYKGGSTHSACLPAGSTCANGSYYCHLLGSSTKSDCSKC